MIKRIAGCCILLGASLGVNAQPVADAGNAPVPDASQSRFAETPGPAAELEKGMTSMLTFLQQEERPDSQALTDFLTKEIAPFFDFDYMAKSAAGHLYRQMSDEQRKQMSETIAKQFLGTMAQRLGGYNSQQIKVISQRIAPDVRTGRVTAAVIGQRGYPSRLDFRFYKAKEGWKVFDVMANGQSAVLHYRRQFRQRMYGSRRQMGYGQPRYSGYR